MRDLRSREMDRILWTRKGEGNDTKRRRKLRKSQRSGVSEFIEDKDGSNSATSERKRER